MSKRELEEEMGEDGLPKREPVSSEDCDFAAALLGSARLDTAAPDLEARILRNLAHRPATKAPLQSGGRARRLVPLALVLAAAAAVVLVARRGPPSSTGKLATAPSSSPSAKAVGGPVIAPEPQPPPSAPEPIARGCVNPIRAAGREPLIDNFEDGNPAMRPLEGRAGTWFLVQDSDPPGTSRSMFPASRPEPTADNHFALHATLGELRDWGATLQVTFQPPCYDASAYAGVAFSARGPGRLYVTALEVRVVAVAYGGTCTHDCYNSHTRKVELKSGWQRFEVPWSELRQRGYQTLPVDPRSLNSVAFQIHAEDTPSDLWIDDVEFLRR